MIRNWGLSVFLAPRLPPKSQMTFIFTNSELFHLLFPSRMSPLPPLLDFFSRTRSYISWEGGKGRCKSGVLEAASQSSTSSLPPLPSLPTFSSFLPPVTFHAQTPIPLCSAHLFPTSISCSYSMVFAVCPSLKFPEHWAGKLCTFHWPRPATKRIYQFTTDLVFQGTSKCLKPQFVDSVFLIWR